MAWAGGGLANNSRTLSLTKTHDNWRCQTQQSSSPTNMCTGQKISIYVTCLNVNKGFSLVEQLWPKWLDAIKGEGDRGHEAGEAGLVGLSHIKVSWCWLFICWDWLKFSCLRRWKRFTSSRTFAKICSVKWIKGNELKLCINKDYLWSTWCQFGCNFTKRWRFVALCWWSCRRHANRHTSSSFRSAPTRTMHRIKLQTTLQRNTGHFVSGE